MAGTESATAEPAASRSAIPFFIVSSISLQTRQGAAEEGNGAGRGWFHEPSTTSLSMYLSNIFRRRDVRPRRRTVEPVAQTRRFAEGGAGSFAPGTLAPYMARHMSD